MKALLLASAAVVGFVPSSLLPSLYLHDLKPVHLMRPSICNCSLSGFCRAFATLSSEPKSGFLSPVAENAIGASDHTLLIATTRERDARPGTLYNGERGTLHYASWRNDPANAYPGQNQMGVNTARQSSRRFRCARRSVSRWRQGLCTGVECANSGHRQRGNRSVFVFIHGYNTLFAEGLIVSPRLFTIQRRRAFPCCLPGRRAGSSRPMSTTTIARQPRATI